MTDLDPIMLAAIRHRRTLDVSTAMLRADLDWLLSRLDRIVEERDLARDYACRLAEDRMEHEAEVRKILDNARASRAKDGL